MTRLLAAILCILTGATLIYLSITRRPRKYITLSGVKLYGKPIEYASDDDMRKYIPVKGFVMIDPQNGLKVQYEKPITLSGHADGKLWAKRL